MTKEILRCPQCSAGQEASPGRNWDYIHQLPGRVRVRSAEIKKYQDKASAIEDTLKAIEGVSEAVVNILTGSVTVLYEPTQVSPEVILGTLRAQGLAPSLRQQNQDRSNGIIQRSGRAVLFMVLEQVVERSVKAAVAALL